MHVYINKCFAFVCHFNFCKERENIFFVEYNGE